jgi:hypothetical protein
MSVETFNSMDRSANLSAMIVGLVVVFCSIGISLSHYSNKLHPTALQSQKSQQFKDTSREKQKIIDLAGTNHSL